MQTPALFQVQREPITPLQDELTSTLAHCAFLLQSAAIVVTDDVARGVALRAVSAAHQVLAKAGRPVPHGRSAA